MTRAGRLAAVTGTLAALALPACQTTQETSSRLAAGAEKLVHAQGLRIGRENRAIAVSGSSVLHDANGVAAVVLLRNRGAAQADVPIGITLSDARGRRLYRNDLPGLDRSLTSVAAVPARGRTFWVNDQIRTGAPPRRAAAKVGAARVAGTAPLPRMELSRVRYERDTDGVFARGVVANRSKLVQRRLVISCISTRGERILAAGRAVVDRLAPAPTPKPVTFRVYFIGDPTGGRLACTAPPTVLKGGPSS